MEGVSDSDCRGRVQACHADTVAVIAAAQTWWRTGRSGIEHLAQIEMAGRPATADDLTSARLAAEQWDAAIHPQVLLLATTHPDPDVGRAARFLALRVWASLFILRQALSGSASRGPQHPELARRLFLLPKVDLALTRLSEAALMAQSRGQRPEQPVQPVVVPDPSHPTFPVWLDRFEKQEHDFGRNESGSMAAPPDSS